MGESALALVRLSGPRAGELACVHHPSRAPLPRQVWHGDYVDQGGNLVDDVVFCLFPGPQSYTGEDVLEVSSHGNPYIVRKIVDDCLARGCRMAEPGEFTRRAFLNGRMDLTSAEAVMELIRARSDRALDAAQQQLRGALGRRIDQLVEDLLRNCAAIEAYIDFPEDDLPPDDRESRLREITGLRLEVEKLAATRRQGELLRNGLKVVLVGAPNVGKSSLLNQLAGYDRAIVSAEPGTTRDFLEEPVLLGPHRIQVIDTAGLRETFDAVERSGVARSLERVEVADLVVLVVDVTLPCPPLPEPVRLRLGAGHALVAANKCDLPGRSFAWDGPSALSVVPVSAVSGEGLLELRTALIAMADGLTDVGGGSEHIAVNARHCAALVDSSAALARAEALLRTRGPLDLVGSELRSAIDALGQIVGRIDHERMLDKLFSSFCIGK